MDTYDQTAVKKYSVYSLDGNTHPCYLPHASRSETYGLKIYLEIHVHRCSATTYRFPLTVFRPRLVSSGGRAPEPWYPLCRYMDLF